jgi:hypothetical protein
MHRCNTESLGVSDVRRGLAFFTTWAMRGPRGRAVASLAIRGGPRTFYDANGRPYAKPQSPSPLAILSPSPLAILAGLRERSKCSRGFPPRTRRSRRPPGHDRFPDLGFGEDAHELAVHVVVLHFEAQDI